MESINPLKANVQILYMRLHSPQDLALQTFQIERSIQPMMNVLFDLPDTQQISICADWLKLEDLNKLDSAVCHRKYRSEYLGILNSPLCKIQWLEVGKHTQCVEWIIRRNLSFEGAMLFAALLTEDILCAKFFATCGHSLQSVFLSAMYASDVPEQTNLSCLWKYTIYLVADHCPQLTDFRLMYSDEKLAYDDEALVYLLTRCTKLTDFTLEEGEAVSRTLLEAICNAPSLQRVNLSDSHLVGLNSIPSRVHSRTVVSLKLHQCEAVDEASMYRMYTMFPCLEHITVTDMQSADLIRLSALCPLLTHLEARVTESTDEETAVVLAQNWKRIECIKLFYPAFRLCSEGAMLTFVRNCPSLKILDVSSAGAAIERPLWLPLDTYVYPADYGGSQLSELYVNSLCEDALCSVLQLCPYLHVLAIHHHNPHSMNYAHTARIRPAELALHHITTSSSIKVLYIHNYSALADCHLLTLSNLHEVYISNVHTQLTSDGIIALCKRCPLLRALRIQSCVGVNNSFVLPLLHTHRSLRLLEFYSRGTKHGDNSPMGVMFAELAKKTYPNIRHLEINYHPI